MARLKPPMDSAANRLDGSAGNDTMDGAGGADVLIGGDGNDSLIGNAGNDSLQGGAGFDGFIWSWGDGRDTFNGGADFDQLTVYGSAAENILRAAWNGSVLTGVIDNALISVEAVFLNGLGGEDWLSYTASASVMVDLGLGAASGFASVNLVENVVGGTGADTLAGDANANKLLGGDGADVLAGVGGADTLTGGLGADRFVYQVGGGADVVTDFDANATGGQDVLDISAFGITSGDFGSRVTITDLGANTLVTIDGTVTINLLNVTGDGDNVITAADFLLA